MGLSWEEVEVGEEGWEVVWVGDVGEVFGAVLFVVLVVLAVESLWLIEVLLNWLNASGIRGSGNLVSWMGSL